MSDLRSFLARVRAERRADLLEVEREVNPRFETAAIVVKLEAERRSPIVLFKRVRGSRFPLVTNVCGSLGRLALALDCPMKDLGSRFGEAVAHPVRPMIVEAGPVQENRLLGADVDLSLLPSLVYHQDDSPQPYLTAAICVARDPEDGHVNLSYHRLMVASRDTTGMLMERGKHLEAIYKKYVAQGRDMPLAVFFGAHPAWSLGALYSGPLDEYDVIGGLLRAPLPVVPCLTQPGLEVPAGAELVLEGAVAHDAWIDEGPFGEFTGYGTGRTKSPIFRVSGMTFRDEMIFQDIVSGHLEHLLLPMPAIENRTLTDARSVAPGVKKISLPAPLTVVVALEKTDDEEPKRLIERLVRSDIYAKHVVVVDADVNPAEPREVFGAIALHVQATRDVFIYPDEQGTPLDPSCTSEAGRTAKMGIDATRRLDAPREVTRNTIPADVLASIDLAQLLKRS